MHKEGIEQQHMHSAYPLGPRLGELLQLSQLGCAGRATTLQYGPRCPCAMCLGCPRWYCLEYQHPSNARAHDAVGEEEAAEAAEAADAAQAAEVGQRLSGRVAQASLLDQESTTWTHVPMVSVERLAGKRFVTVRVETVAKAAAHVDPWHNDTGVQTHNFLWELLADTWIPATVAVEASAQALVDVSQKRAVKLVTPGYQ